MQPVPENGQAEACDYGLGVRTLDQDLGVRFMRSLFGNPGIGACLVRGIGEAADEAYISGNMGTYAVKSPGVVQLKRAL